MPSAEPLRTDFFITGTSPAGEAVSRQQSGPTAPAARDCVVRDKPRRCSPDWRRGPQDTSQLGSPPQYRWCRYIAAGLEQTPGMVQALRLPADTGCGKSVGWSGQRRALQAIMCSVSTRFLSNVRTIALMGLGMDFRSFALSACHHAVGADALEARRASTAVRS